jgi:hypothetical protein
VVRVFLVQALERQGREARGRSLIERRLHCAGECCTVGERCTGSKEKRRDTVSHMRMLPFAS